MEEDGQGQNQQCRQDDLHGEHRGRAERIAAVCCRQAALRTMSVAMAGPCPRRSPDGGHCTCGPDVSCWVRCVVGLEPGCNPSWP